jgi:hypothetical protein
MSLLDQLTTDDKDIQQETDSVGTSFSPLESGLYLLKVIFAYITISAGEAMALNILFETPTKQRIRQQFWMTSGKDKGKKNFYINKKTKEKHYLPGFNQANGIALLTCNKGINQMVTETKTINLYDYDQKKEVPKDVDMIVELIDKEITAGVIKQIVDKNVQNDTGAYVPSGETRVENEVDKLFHTDGRTITEIRAKKPATFKDTWLERWEGKVKDKSAAKAGVVSGAPKANKVQTATGGTTAKADSLFQD